MFHQNQSISQWGHISGGRVASPTQQYQMRGSLRASLHAGPIPILSTSQQDAHNYESTVKCVSLSSWSRGMVKIPPGSQNCS